MQARNVLDAGSRARRRDTFLCSAKEKYPKERRPEVLPAPRVPCASRENRRLRNSQSRYARMLKQGASFIRFSLRCSAAPTGGQTFKPVALTEYRSQSGKQVRTLSEGARGPASNKDRAFIAHAHPCATRCTYIRIGKGAPATIRYSAGAPCRRDR